MKAIDHIADEVVSVLLSSSNSGLDLKETMRWQHIDESLSRGDITSILRTKEEAKLDELVGMNQGLLQCIGTSHVSIEVCQITAAFKLRSKLIGAGGGGCVFCQKRILLPDT